MIRRARLAIAGIAVATLLAIVLIATTVGGAGSAAAARRRVVIQPALADAGVARPRSVATDNTSTSTSTTTIPPTTTLPPPTTTAPTVTVPKVAARPAVIAAPAPLRAQASDAGDYALLGYRWNPCQVITVSSSGPDITTIVGELASITGLNLQMVSGPADITVQWGAIPAGGELGLTSWDEQGGWLTKSLVVISPGAPYMATVLRHEMGHAMGLMHAHHPNEVMYATVGPSSPTDYQAGDRAGLVAVGASAGCSPN